MNVTKLTMSNFDEEVINSDKPVLIDFWASWCGPCRMLSPIVDEIAEEYPEYKICKVNVDEEQELASTFQVYSIPSLVVIKNNKITASAVGYRPKNDVLKLFHQDEESGNSII